MESPSRSKWYKICLLHEKFVFGIYQTINIFLRNFAHVVLLMMPAKVSLDFCFFPELVDIMKSPGFYMPKEASIFSLAFWIQIKSNIKISARSFESSNKENKTWLKFKRKIVNPAFAEVPRNLFILPQKRFPFSRYLSFCLDFLVSYQNGLI